MWQRETASFQESSRREERARHKGGDVPALTHTGMLWLLLPHLLVVQFHAHMRGSSSPPQQIFIPNFNACLVQKPVCLLFGG